jgi:ABC-type uncharacterized transport system substrate-binding protein
MTLRRTAFLALTIGLATSAASAHPHVWATMRTAVIANEAGLVKGVGIAWTFDETYTQFALEGLDVNNDGTFQPEEIKPLTDENIKSLEESQYFTYVRQAGKALPYGPVTDYGQTLDGDKLTLFFVVPLASPADPKAGEIDFKVYDPDFFIAFDYMPDNPTRLEGTLASGCATELKPLPTAEELDATRMMLSDKPQDWKPEEPTDFGSMFAQSLITKCG